LSNNIPGKQEKTLLVIIMRITQTSKNKMERMEKTARHIQNEIRMNTKTYRKHKKPDITIINRLTERK
jgi:hypothetical protein